MNIEVRMPSPSQTTICPYTSSGRPKYHKNKSHGHNPSIQTRYCIWLKTVNVYPIDNQQFCKTVTFVVVTK